MEQIVIDIRKGLDMSGLRDFEIASALGTTPDRLSKALSGIHAFPVNWYDFIVSNITTYPFEEQGRRNGYKLIYSPETPEELLNEFKKAGKSFELLYKRLERALEAGCINTNLNLR